MTVIVPGLLAKGAFAKNITVIEGIDCTKKDCADRLVAGLKGKKVDLVVYVSGVVIPEVSPMSALLHQFLLIRLRTAIRRSQLGRSN